MKHLKKTQCAVAIRDIAKAGNVAEMVLKTRTQLQLRHMQHHPAGTWGRCRCWCQPTLPFFGGHQYQKTFFLIVCASDVGSDILDEPPLARSMFTQTKKRILTCPFLHNISVGLNINKRCSWQVRLRKSRPIGGEVTPTSSMSNLKVVKSKCGKSPSGRRGSRSSKLRTPWTFQRFHVFQFWMVEFLGDV